MGRIPLHIYGKEAEQKKVNSKLRCKDIHLGKENEQTGRAGALLRGKVGCRV